MKPHKPAELSLIEMLDHAATSTEPAERIPDKEAVTRTSFRLPQPILDELTALAKARDMSKGLIINLLIDDFLRGQGRPSYDRLAPWYADYALRKKGKD